MYIWGILTNWRSILSNVTTMGRRGTNVRNGRGEVREGLFLLHLTKM